MVIPQPAERRILLVANRTLGGLELATTVRDRVAAGATELWIVVPATVPPDGAGVTAAGAPRPAPDRSAVEVAEGRLREATYRFADLGIPVGGEVSDKEPFDAVSDALSRRTFDEVVVSTLPATVSHWLRTDLPSRLHRTFGLPVTTVTARR